jgi:hypothetical protein
MSAQGGTISGRAPMHLPLRAMAVVLAAATAAAVGLGVIDFTSPAPAEQVVIGELQGVWESTISHPRAGYAEQAQVSEMPVQRLYPEGFAEQAQVSEMPVQRLYPEGFGEPKDEGSTKIFDGRRRKW